MGKESRLGRGMGAILGGGDSSSYSKVEASGASKLDYNIPIDEIERNPDQPRKDFDPVELLNLSNSIKAVGVITPITLRKISEHKYQIIAGERRYRASKMAGKTTIPAYVCEASEKEVAEMALIENIQRTDLNPIEVALSYKSLMEKGNYTQEELSERVGKNRTTVSNFLRLLGLPSEIQMGLKERIIENGHARALLGIDDAIKQLEVYNDVVKKGLSVRAVEDIVRNLKNNKPNSTPNKNEIPEEIKTLVDDFAEKIGKKVNITRNAKGKGKITIEFDSDSDFENIMEKFDSIKDETI